MPAVLIPYLHAAPYLTCALGLLATLCLFANLKIELRRVVRRERQRAAALIAAQFSEHQPVFIPVAPLPGLNIQRRAHAMRLLKRGEDPAYTASALGITRREVELLIRVQQMVEQRGTPG